MTAQVLTNEQRALVEVWEQHMAAEFERQSAADAIATMTQSPSLTHVPVATGATGREALHNFYAHKFCPCLPPDAELQLLTRTVGQNRIVDEMILRFTHTVRMDWFAPGIEPAGKRIELPNVAVIQFEEGKIVSEHIYWDQASVLVQLGLLDAANLPVLGAEEADRLMDTSAPANQLIDRLKAVSD